MQHFLIYFSAEKAASIVLHDLTRQGLQEVDITRMFKDEMLSSVVLDHLKLGGENFTIRYVRTKRAPGNTNKIYLCANGREVVGRNLASFVPKIPRQGSLGKEEKFYLLPCVTGDFLDRHVKPERTAFDIPMRSEFDGTEDPEETLITLERIFGDVGSRAAVHLSDVITAIKTEEQDALRNYIFQEPRRRAKYRALVENPRYRPLLEQLNLPQNPKPSDFELALTTARIKIEEDIHRESQELYQARPDGPGVSLEALRDRHNALMEQLDVLKQMDLVDYVVHRKMILEYLEKSLEWSKEEKYMLEEAVHRIFHPLNTSSDSIHQNFQNLWVLDERLMYHSYLASDMKLASNKHTDSESLLEPDMYLAFDEQYFDNPHAYRQGERSPSVVIIEFKRPGKNQYVYGHPKKDPLEQVRGYAKKVKAGKIKSHTGKTVGTAEGAQFFGYIVIDFTEEARTLLERYADVGLLQADFAKFRYFGYFKDAGIYLEVIDLGSLIDEAKLRSQFLFQRLGIDETKVL
ncbi:hypothetical protein [Deinococcus cellulosilyticus]|uniref:Uncharacterized protein n=1 Tax=Deinococcus cellulosilyticus (strain DSM 18568 / NBRC 106333 / KACC 11606 / 5516J-15) TaxID=1223518 RepID=A0A511N1C2_DEIC1|nr:hypothetical protein [Deinococcus cellulosilyticus]GEM46662.1 hypothetical protein DC3_22970 [Deinococcus cellulosilyticus NBRC 106333 = KACC 11606]